MPMIPKNNSCEFIIQALAACKTSSMELKFHVILIAKENDDS